MLVKKIVASKAAKIATMCVCPVVGTGVVVTKVPAVRRAVHHYTEPHVERVIHRHVRRTVTTITPSNLICPPVYYGPMTGDFNFPAYPPITTPNQPGDYPGNGGGGSGIIIGGGGGGVIIGGGSSGGGSMGPGPGGGMGGSSGGGSSGGIPGGNPPSNPPGTGTTNPPPPGHPVGSVPEAGTWLMMLTGFGVMGMAIRRRVRMNIPASQG